MACPFLTPPLPVPGSTGLSSLVTSRTNFVYCVRLNNLSLETPDIRVSPLLTYLLILGFAVTVTELEVFTSTTRAGPSEEVILLCLYSLPNFL